MMKWEGFDIDEDNRTRDLMVLACSHGFTGSDWQMLKYGVRIETSEIPPANDLIADQLTACRIVGEMGRQPKPVNSWLFFCYGHKDMSDYLYNLYRANYYLCQPGHKIVDGVPHISETPEYQLATMALHDYRKRVQGQPSTPEEVLMTAVGTRKWAWKSHYKAMFDRYLERVKNWDIQGVASVSIVIRRIFDGG